MLIEVSKYSDSLKSLWLKVFGDDEEYINLIFDKGYTPNECFGYVDNDCVVSAFYLLKCKIKVNGNIFNGRYLYAAATLPEYRGKGIMGNLIAEAEEYVRNNSVDFISLVPASEGLYHYYGKFGFKASMYNYECVAADPIKKSSDFLLCDEREFYAFRDKAIDDSLLYDFEDFLYATSCLKYAGYKLYKNTDDSYFIADEEFGEILEYVSSKENLIKNTQALLFRLKKGTTVASCHDLSEILKCDKKTYGMIFSANEVVENTVKNGIYMNIALD